MQGKGRKMKYLVYRNIQTAEIVNEEDWEYYALEQLGITIKQKVI